MSEQLLWVQCDKITPNKYQPRKEFNTKDLEELAESIDQQGLIQPITVRKLESSEDGFEYELIAGERRWRATKEILGKDKIRAIVKEMTDKDSQEAAITENLQRADLNAMEEAIALQNLMDNFALTQTQISKRLGKSRSYISNICRLLKLPQEVQTMVATGQLEKHKAWSLLAVEDVKNQVHIAQQAVQKNWTFERLRVEIEATIVKASEEPPAPLEKAVTEIHTADGEIKKVEVSKPVTPKQQIHGNRKIKPQPKMDFMVLVEFDSETTVKEFVDFMKEQNWQCWKAEAALKKIKELEAAAVASTVSSDVEPLLEI